MSAARSTRPSGTAPARRRVAPGPFVALALGAVAVVAVGFIVLALLVGSGLDWANPFRSSTVDRSGPATLQSLTDLKEFHAASGYYEVVIDQEVDVANLPAFLAGERVLFVAAGSVDAVVDFSALGDGAVTTDPDRKAVTVRLPAVQLGKPALDLQRSYVANHQRGLRERLQDALGNQPSSDVMKNVYTVAERRLAEAAGRTNELRTRAEDNTRAMLTVLLTEAGYTTVTVVFTADG